MSNENPSVIYNVAHGKFAPLTDQTFVRLGKHLKGAGFDGISALPYRGADTIALYRDHFPGIKVVEEWNPGNYDNIFLATLQGLWGQVRRATGDTSEPPILQDTLLFPSKISSETIIKRLLELDNNTYFVASHFEDLDLGRFPGRTHVHDQSDFRPHVLELNEVIELAQTKQIKLWHDPKRPIQPKVASYPSKPTVQSMSQGIAEIPYLTGKLAGVDLPSSSKKEIAELLAGKGILADTVLAARQAGAGLLRVEVIAPLTTYLPSLGLVPDNDTYLKDIVDAIKQLEE